jgi:hypothetical protein
MKNIKTLLIFLVISTSLFAQKTEYVDSVFIMNTFKSKIVITEYLEPTQDLLDSDYLKIATDESMNLVISDSLTSRFIKPKHIKEKKLSNNTLSIIESAGIDSTSNVLLIKVHMDGCVTCVNSIIDAILDYNDVYEFINDKRNKSIYVTYYQLVGELRWEFITVTVSRRFGFPYSYTLYSEK